MDTRLRTPAAALCAVLSTYASSAAAQDAGRPDYGTYEAQLAGLRGNAQFEMLLDAAGVNIDAFVECGTAEEDDDRKHEWRAPRGVDSIDVVRFEVLEDGTLGAAYILDFLTQATSDADIDQCVDEALAKLVSCDEDDLDCDPDAPRPDVSELAAQLGIAAGSHFSTDVYGYNYADRQVARRGFVIGLYTLSVATAASGVGAFVAARHDDSDLADLDLGSSNGAQNLRDRPDRFRRAAWSMVGVSLTSFVTATLLNERHRDIERRENPTLVVAPGAEGADVGLTLTTRF
ncbi:MAG: hypothetical protein H6700_10190 [Myxococcales bacterium]|nr:hypothetical protein [Myxococcales bacterium]MCB9520719.1 hypothetical protein [Myxococcales bacterium]MCB9532123.1 hypothetical protein [Myxococcales bacterium]